MYKNRCNKCGKFKKEEKKEVKYFDIDIIGWIKTVFKFLKRIWDIYSLKNMAERPAVRLYGKLVNPDDYEYYTSSRLTRIKLNLQAAAHSMFIFFVIVFGGYAILTLAVHFTAQASQ
jgi:hypothetical protein